ncbi:MAG: phosphodiester glycosidase family protein [Butyrivibrio sp.]
MTDRLVKRKKRKTNKIRKIIGRIFAVLGVTLAMTVAGIYIIMWICTHGPSPVAKDLFVLSVRESSAGGFLANLVCTKEEIAEIEERNKVADTDEITDTTLIHFKDKEDNTEEIEIKGREPYLKKEGILFYEVSGSTYSGTMIVVEDPGRVFVGTSGDYKGEPGINVPAICEKYGAVLATNAGGFEDIGGVGDGGTPLGVVFSEGEMKYGRPNETYNLIGFDNNNVFVIGTMTGKEAIERGIRDAVSFGPFLIVNGTPLEVTGMGGGLNPRTAIGQRADGAVLLLVIDGRQTHSLGASMNDLINVMLDFGAVNAANLDGGGSTVLYYDGEVQNKISSIYGARGIPTAICVR